MSRLSKIAEMLRKQGLDGLVLTEGSGLRYAIQLGGLEGMALICADGTGWCFTDSRFIEVAEKDLTPRGYQVVMPDKSYPECAQQIAQQKGLKRVAYEDDRMAVRQFEQYKHALPCEFVPLGNALVKLRETKEPWEVECICAAQRIAERSLDEMLGVIKPGMSEMELTAELEYRMSKYGSEGVAFPTILLTGPNASMPHGVPGNRKVQENDVVLLDFGARIEGYCSDMTRTVYLGKPDEEFVKVYEIVKEAQKVGCEAMHAGATAIEVDGAARKVIEDAGYGKCFGHNLGHSLGLDVHEPPSASPRLNATFEEGLVLTIEPGIYLPGKFGVRIEDMMYLSPEGPKNLTRATKDLIIL